MRLSIPEKTALDKYELNEETHIKVNQVMCSTCDKKPCTTVCPAGVYVYDSVTALISVDHAGCLECGTCIVACTPKGLTWEYPVGGYGVHYRYA
jgi:ferredoxin like protein